MTNQQLNELLKQRKAELEYARRKLAEAWLTCRETRRSRKIARRLWKEEEMLASAEALLYPLQAPKIGFEETNNE